jgi:hypothetical protein
MINQIRFITNKTISFVLNKTKIKTKKKKVIIKSESLYKMQLFVCVCVRVCVRTGWFLNISSQHRGRNVLLVVVSLGYQDM